MWGADFFIMIISNLTSVFVSKYNGEYLLLNCSILKVLSIKSSNDILKHLENDSRKLSEGATFPFS